MSEQNGRIVYYCETMKFFGERLIRHFGYRRYDPEIDIDKSVLFEGLYFPEDYRIFINHHGERSVFWNGTDIRNLLVSYGWQLIMQENPARHYCHTTMDQKVLSKAGVNAIVHPLFFGDINKYQVSYHQSDTPQVYLNAHPQREEEYGIPLALEVAKEMPKVRFHIYGIDGQNTENVIYHGWVDEEVMDEEIKHFQGCFFPYSNSVNTRISQVCLKSAFMAQYPISINQLDGVWYAPDKAEIIKYLGLLKEQVTPNYVLREKYLKAYEWKDI